MIDPGKIKAAFPNLSIEETEPCTELAIKIGTTDLVLCIYYKDSNDSFYFFLCGNDRPYVYVNTMDELVEEIEDEFDEYIDELKRLLSGKQNVR